MRTINQAFLGMAGLLLSASVAWATAPPNPTSSDGDHNTAGGSGALGLVNSDAHVSFDNTAFGFGAGGGLNNGGDKNTLFGSDAMPQSVSGATSENTAIGYMTLFNNTADFNTAVGTSVLTTNTSGTGNTGVGRAALLSNDTGSFNTAVGYHALNNTNASNNNAVGAHALENNTTGSNNNAQGFNALFNNTSGNSNLAMGAGALKLNQAGSTNVAVGASALFSSTGTGNIAIGTFAGQNLTSGDGNLYLANQGQPTESHTIRIGSGGHTRTFITGITGAAVSNSSTVLINTSTGQLGIPVSSARFKNDIADLADADLKLAQLRPVHFTYKADATRTKHYGLIAEDVAKVYPEMVTHDANGEVVTLDYQALIPLLVKQVQMQQADNARMQAEIAELRARLDSR